MRAWWFAACLVGACSSGSSRSDERAAPAPTQAAPAPPEPAPTQAAPAPPAPAAARTTRAVTTVNEFLAREPLTFVVGTAGDERSDRAVAAQAGLIRPLFPSARLSTDDVSEWPANAVVYGGPHVNRLLARATELPFRLEPGKLVIGGETFEGDDWQLIAVVPAGDDHPEFLLYAGTGTPGIAEINGIKHGPEQVLVADAFGRFAAGTWAQLSARARRIEWRAVVRGRDTLLFPASIAADDDEARLIDACERGVATAAARLELADPSPLSIYVYPDRNSKRALTGDAGDGHARPHARTLHVVRSDGLESLLAHEATHVLAYEAWGPPGTALLGEGVAVWASGRYAGVTLDEWRARLSDRRAIAALLGPSFRRLPERETYPIAGLLVDVSVKRLGLPKVRDHLYRADAEAWDAACRAAGTSAAELEAAVPGR